MSLTDDQTAPGQHSEQPTRDPSQLIPPYVDTSVPVFKDYSFGDFRVLSPAFLAVMVAFGFLVVGNLTLMAATGGFAIAWALTVAIVRKMTRWYHTPRGRLGNWVAHLRRRRTFPWRHDDRVATDVHGVSRFRADGSAEMVDGRLVGLVRVDPTNTALATEDDRNQLAAQLSRAIDEEIKSFDFRLYSTTVETDPGEVVGEYETRAERGVAALSDAPTSGAYQREYLRDIAEWHRNENRPAWGTRRWQHYIAVDVTDDCVARSTNDSLRSMLNPFGDSTDDDREERKQTLLESRLGTVERAIAGIDGLSAHRVAPETHVDLCLRYWTDRSFAAVDADHSGNPLRKFLREKWPSESAPPAQHLLTPGDFRVDDGVVHLADQHCLTAWIAEWPVEPPSLFLRELVTRPDLDVDVCVHAHAEDKRDKQHAIDEEIADIESEGFEREDASDVSALDVDRDIDAYLRYRELLQTTSTQPWRVTGYVTVRADSEDAIQHAREALTDHDSLALAKEAALRDDQKAVRQTLEASPAECFVVAPKARQLEAFRSCSPVSRDAYNAATDMDKARSVPGGAIGAMFPFCATGIREDAGMDWGRNEQNGDVLKADPFARGLAPHLLTIGKSRSGKTYSVSKNALRWYLQSDDHTLILCDTQTGFEGVTDLVDGKHIVVDGTQTINPLDIQPVPEHVRESGRQVDPYRMKIDEATSFIAGILRAQGIDPGPYVSTIEELLEATYSRAGISQGDLDSHAKESPTLDAFIDTGKAVLEDAESFTLTGHADESERKRTHVADLLDKLSSFKANGKYQHLVGETETGITDPDVDMAYLDLQQLRDADAAEKSVMLQLMLSQVSEKVKRTSGKLVFVIDEAHVLLHSAEMVQWLQKAAREWARYDAAMWFVSQSPREFIQQLDTKQVGQENQRRTIADQCSTLQFFRTPRIKPDALRQFGLNDRQIRWIRDEATPGRAGKGYAESLLHFEDKRGWFQTCVEASPFEDLVLNYSSREHGDFDAYLQRRWGPIAGVPFEEQADLQEAAGANGDAGDARENGESESAPEGEGERDGSETGARTGAPRTIGWLDDHDD